MRILSILLTVLFLPIFAYTLYVAATYGLNIFPLFFGEIIALSWTGQFHLDFLIYLLLSAGWIGWRHRWSAKGIIMALIASVLGACFLLPYLIWVGIQTQGDMGAFFLGEKA